LAALDRVHRRERRRAQRRERMAGLVSHEIKTTVTIAGGYLDLVLGSTPESPVRDDVEVARDELHRLSRSSERLIRMMGIQEEFVLESVDANTLMTQVVERWSAVADRKWHLDVAAGRIDCAPMRLRACFDTLIENSLRHTPPDGSIRLLGFQIGDRACLGVADSGPGLTDEQAQAVNQQFLPGGGEDDGAQEHSHSGLGLSIVQEVAREHGGRLVAGRSAEGGALLLMVLPFDVHRSSRAIPRPRTAADARTARHRAVPVSRA
jgi:signal transduction histidine kinase